MATGINALKELFKQYKVRIQNEGKILLEQALSDLSSQFHEIRGLQWKQYTPYFCDGEPCHFGVGEVMVAVAKPQDEVTKCPKCTSELGANARFCSQCGTARPAPSSELEFEDSYYLKNRILDPVRSAESIKMISQFSRGISDISDVMQVVFGDHIQITALLDKGKVSINVEKYEDHD